MVVWDERALSLKGLSREQRIAVARREAELIERGHNHWHARAKAIREVVAQR